MNLSDFERLAARVIDAEPRSVTETSQIEQLVAACKGGRTLAVMDALFRQAAHELIKDISPGTDLHNSVLILGAPSIISKPESDVLKVLASYACGDPDHAYEALVEYHDAASTIPEAQTNLAALIRIAKAVHSGRISMKEHTNEDS